MILDIGLEGQINKNQTKATTSNPIHFKNENSRTILRTQTKITLPFNGRTPLMEITMLMIKSTLIPTTWEISTNTRMQPR
jgi:hypothetical protein